MMPTEFNTTLQKRGPLGKIAARKATVLPVERIHPEVRIAHRLTHTDEFCIPRRIIFDHELILFLRGEGRVSIDAREASFKPNQLFFIQPFVPHEMQGLPGCTIEHIALHFDFAPDVPRFSSDLKRRKPYQIRLTHGLTVPETSDLPAAHPIVKMLGDLVQISDSDRPTARLEVSNLLSRVLTELINRLPSGESSPAVEHRNRVKLERVMEYVRSNLREPLSVQELAEVADLSESHLARLMREWAGRSPHEFVSEARIARARQLLADVDLNIKQIALATGFKSPHHFSRVFRKLDGLPPTQFREALLAGRAQPE